MPEPGIISRTWHRYLRLNLHGLIVAALDRGLPWLDRPPAHVQRDAVAAVERAGGNVQYHRIATDDPPWWPDWLVDRLGVDCFDSVEWVDMRLEKCWDADLAKVGRLSDLGWLTLWPLPWDSPARALTDAGLLHLKGLTNLTYLDLSVSSTPVTDGGLVHLGTLANLTRLELSNTQVTDAGLVHLKGLTNLTALVLSQTHVTDAGLAHLKSLTNLAFLDLRRTQATDAGVNDLNQTLPRLAIDR